MKQFLFGFILCWELCAQSNQQPAKDPLLYLYSTRLDAAGQSVEKAAGAVANGSVFETQLENLKVIAQRETDRIFSSQRRAALVRIEAARDWETMADYVRTAKERALRSDEEKEEWSARTKELKDLLAAMPKPATTETNPLKEAADFLVELGRAQEIVTAAKFLSEKSINDVSQNDLRIIKRLQEGIAAVGANLTALSQMPLAATTRTAEQKMKTDLLIAELDSLRNLGLIEARRQAGQQEVAKLIRIIENVLRCSGTKPRICTMVFQDDDGGETSEELAIRERIEVSLARWQNNPAKLKVAVYLMQNFAALVARAETPARIADLRSAVEDRRLSIRKDAIFARAYEQIFSLGAQRLALFAKGGIKPETLAALAQAAVTAGLIPAVALR